MSTEQQQLVELQRRIAEARGYTNMFDSKCGWMGVLHADEGRTAVPRWPWDISDAWELADEMSAGPDGRWDLRKVSDGYIVQRWDVDPHGFRRLDGLHQAPGDTAEEAICRCWCAWKGIGS